MHQPPHRLLLFAAALCACVIQGEEDDDDTDNQPQDEDGVTAEIGPEGGVLEDGVLRLEIPEGALPENVTLSMRVDEDVDMGDRLSPSWVFEPAGLEFEQPVYVEIALDSDATGTLMWSRLDDETAFEPVGLAAAGIAAGYTTHFSSTHVEGETCTVAPPAITRCGCRADDEIGDLVCPVDPVANGGCPDINGFMGSDGGGCSGYALRDETEFHCACYSETDGYLCPDAHVLGPMQHCPSVDGLNGHVGEPGAGCSGSTIEYDPETGDPMNVGGSGTLVDCTEVVTETTVESIGGTLEGCYETSPALSCPYMDPDTNEPIFGLLPDCKNLLDGLAQKGRTTACDTAIGSASTVGTRAGNQIEQRITGMNGADAPTMFYSQVVVPYGSKKHCESTTPLENRGDGKLDLVAVVDRTPERVTIEIIEVKPLTPSGLPAGEHDIYTCYAGVVADAGSKCDDKPVPAAYAQFCDTLDADGAEVVLADPEGGFLDPLMNFEYEDPSGAKHPMHVLTCMPGVFAYQCVN